MTDDERDKVLAAVSADQPAGEDFESTPGYLELDGAVRGRRGDQWQEPIPPNWSRVRELAMATLERSKHLRPAICLVAAEVELNGLPGLHQGLSVVRGLLERYWPTLHPQLDPEDDNDPMRRLNIVNDLSPPPGIGQMDDPLQIPQRVRRVTLCQSPQASFGLRHWQMARGEIEPDPGDEPAPDAAVIEATFQATDSAELKQTLAAIDGALKELETIAGFLAERVETEAEVDFSALEKVLDQQRRLCGSYVDVGGEAAVEPGGPVVEAGTAGGGGTGGEIRSSQDVRLTLDRICRYYENCEPSSPVPLLLKRARRLVDKPFNAILEDLAPQALSQVREITGEEDEGKPPG